MIKEAASARTKWRMFVIAGALLSVGAISRAEVVNANFTGKITSSTCSVVSQNISVPLGSHDIADFGGAIGSVRGEKSFMLGVRCPSTDIQVLVTVSASNIIYSNIGVFGVTGGATGVGIQLLDWQRKPVPFGTQIDYGKGHPTNWDLEYYARYYRTSTTMTSGNANGMASFTLQYR